MIVSIIISMLLFSIHLPQPTLSFWMGLLFLAAIGFQLAQVVTDVNAEGFDASKLNNDQLSKLNQDSSAKLEPEPPAAPAAQPAESQPPKAPDQPPAPGSTEPPPPAAKEPPAPPAETLLAGKYKNVDELGRGLTEIAKNLKYHPGAIERLIELAKKTGDTAALEQTYHDLYGAQVRKEQALEPAQQPGTTEQPAAGEDAQAEALKETNAIFTIALEQFQTHPLMQELKARGLAFPKTQEDLADLKVTDRALVFELNQEFGRVFGKIQADVRNIRKAEAEVKPHNTSMIESAKKEIAEVAKQYGLKTVDDAKIQAIIDAAMQTPFPFDERHGVKFLRDKGLLKFFYAEEFPQLAAAIKLNGELNGRTQHAEDIQTMRAKGLDSLTQTRTPGSTAITTPKPIDVDDEQQLSTLGIDELIKLRDQGIPKS